MPLNNRFSTTTQGSIIFIGNTLGLSQQLNTNNAGTAGSIGAFAKSDTTTQANTTWPLGTTFDYNINKSEAILNIPDSSNILHAELIWSGNYLSVNQNISSDLNKQVQFTTPLGMFNISPDPSTSQQEIFPSTTGSNLGVYSRSQDVTNLVQSGGNGTYSLGGVPGLIDPSLSSTSSTNNAGWTLAIIYENMNAPLRNMTLFTGLEIISTEINSFTDINLSGFTTPVSGSLNGRLLLSVSEGDANIAGDQVQFGTNTNNLSVISGPNNLQNNFFASQINDSNGNLDTTGTFGNRNQNPATTSNISAGRQGWDITNVDISQTLSNSQTSAVARLTTQGDTYFPNALALQIDINSARFVPNYKSVDKDFADVGDTLTYTLPITNDGEVVANDVFLIDTIPNGVSFVSDSITIDGIPISGQMPQNGIDLDDISPGETVTVTFQVIVTDISPNPNPIPNVADITYNFLPAPNLPVVFENLESNVVTTTVNHASLKGITKFVDLEYATCGDILTYTIVIENAGNVDAMNVILSDTIPNGTNFIEDSLSVNGAPRFGENPQSGINLNTISPGEIITITFNTQIIC